MSCRIERLRVVAPIFAQQLIPRKFARVGALFTECDCPSVSDELRIQIDCAQRSLVNERMNPIRSLDCQRNKLHCQPQALRMTTAGSFQSAIRQVAFHATRQVYDYLVG